MLHHCIRLLYVKVREAFIYYPDTGIFRHRARVELTAKDREFNKRYAGKVAGALYPHGYIKLRVGNRRYHAHRIAVLWMTGRLPSTQYDHLNGCRRDNRWANIRPATNSQNRRNHPLSGTARPGIAASIAARPGSHSASP